MKKVALPDIDPPPKIPADVKARLRAIIKGLEWKASTAEEYKLAPHEYIVAMKCYPQFKELSNAVRDYGVYRAWLRKRDRKRFRYKYLILDTFCYWTMFPVLNRAKADTLDS